jgi:hypothetical protein
MTLFILSSCKEHCKEYPSYDLTGEQLSWFRPEGEVWTFVNERGDTVKGKVGSFETTPNFEYDSHASATCRQLGPAQQIGFLTISFNKPFYPYANRPLDQIGYSGSSGIPPTYGVVNNFYNINGSFFKAIDTLTVSMKGQTYLHTMILTGENPYVDAPDTLYATKEEGILKMVFSKPSLVWERVPL